MAEAVWTEPGLNDLREIIEYIALDSPVYAERLGTRIVEAPRQLIEFPESGRIVPEFSDSTIRELIYGAYRIIYVIRPEACYITSVIHGSRDILQHMKPGDWDIT